MEWMGEDEGGGGSNGWKRMKEEGDRMYGRDGGGGGWKGWERMKEEEDEMYGRG